MYRTAVMLLVGVIGLSAMASSPQNEPTSANPIEYVYTVRGTTELKAHVFSPPRSVTATGAVVIFHGGGWKIGSPEWAFPMARHFASKGMVGVAAQYRLADESTITPREAMADARAVIRWLRTSSDTLGIDPDRIAAYGWSAGAHLAACAAIFNNLDSGSESQVSCSPNALVLKSPAVSVTHDRWFQRISGGPEQARDASPDGHVRAGLPPALILQGDVDTVTPLAGVKRFCDRMRAAGNVCELELYEGYGHLFTPAGTPDDGWPQPDPKIIALATARTDEFLRSLGFME